MVLSSLTCLDEQGRAVDWWFVYKMPASFQFAYKDANDHSEVPLKLAPALLNRTDTGALGSTLHQIYQGKNRMIYHLHYGMMIIHTHQQLEMT